MIGTSSEGDPSALAEELKNVATLPKLRSACEGRAAYLVGGVVRDALLGAGADVADVDISVEGDVAGIARGLDPEALVNDRFGTARAIVDGVVVDFAASRAERYERPGALPEVERAGLDADLARRDFTVNAMAVPLEGDPLLIDPHDGLADLRAGVLRVLHAGSIADDPTRALRAARYAARLGFEPDAGTAGQIAAADMGTVSADRVRAELDLIAEEREAAKALALAAGWGLIDADPARIEAAGRAAALSAEPRWATAPRAAAVLMAAGLAPGNCERLAAVRPSRPSEAVRAAAGHTAAELLAARALGAEWLDDHADRWAGVSLEIAGGDLLAAGVPEGPAVGAGLQAALEAKLDRGAAGAEEELRIALEAARAAGE